jgi:hypothetical protein
MFKKMEACVAVLMLASGLLGLTEPAESRSFRNMTPIATPGSDAVGASEGAGSAGITRPVTREVGEQALTRVVEAWNTGQLAQTVSEQFFDKSRLLDAIDADVPRDASLRLVTVQAVQTLSQRVESDPRFGPVLVSRISATARTQVEFNDPNTGVLVNRPGVNEFIMVVKQRAVP